MFRTMLGALAVPDDPRGMFVEGEGGAPEGGGEPSPSTTATTGAEGQQPDAEAKPDGEPTTTATTEEKPATPDPLAELSADAEVKAMLENAQADGKPLQITKEMVDGLSPAAKLILVETVRRARAEQQAALEGANKTLTEREKAAAERERLATEKHRKAQQDRAAISKFGPNDPRIKAVLDAAEKPLPAGADPYSPEAIEKRAQQAAAKVIREVFGAMGQIGEAEAKAIEQADAQAAYDAEVEANTKFMEQHAADFARKDDGDDEDAMGVDYDGKPVRMYDFMVELTTKRGMKLPQAHAIATSLRDAALVRGTDAEAIKRAREKNKPSHRREAVPTMPDGLTTQQQLEWMARNQEGTKRTIEQHLANRT